MFFEECCDLYKMFCEFQFIVDKFDCELCEYCEVLDEFMDVEILLWKKLEWVRNERVVYRISVEKFQKDFKKFQV